MQIKMLILPLFFAFVSATRDTTPPREPGPDRAALAAPEVPAATAAFVAPAAPATANDDVEALQDAVQGVQRFMNARDQLNGRSVMMNRNGLMAIKHVCDMLTNMDPEKIKQAFNWVKTKVKDDKKTAAFFFGFFGVLTIAAKPAVQLLDPYFKQVHEWETPHKLAFYQMLMFIRVFVSGFVPASSPTFTAAIQAIETGSANTENCPVDHATSYIIVGSVFPNLLARIPGFSNFMWKYASKNKTLGKPISEVMTDAFENGNSVEEKVGNALALGHFALGSGTFTSLVAGLFTLSVIDMAFSGVLGVSDDLFVNIVLKSTKCPDQALNSAWTLISLAQFFQIAFSGLSRNGWECAMHALNFGILQAAMILLNGSEIHPAMWMPMMAMVANAIILPWSEQFAATQLRNMIVGQEQSDLTEPLMATENDA